MNFKFTFGCYRIVAQTLTYVCCSFSKCRCHHAIIEHMHEITDLDYWRYKLSLGDFCY